MSGRNKVDLVLVTWRNKVDLVLVTWRNKVDLVLVSGRAAAVLLAMALAATACGGGSGGARPDTTGVPSSTAPADPSPPAATTDTTSDPTEAEPAPAPRSWRDCAVDVHTHLDGLYRSAGGAEADFLGAAETALARMDEAGVETAILMPPPISDDPGQLNTYDYTALVEAVAAHPDRLALLAGGGLLNPTMTAGGPVDDTDVARFAAQAGALAAEPGVAGFGEMAALHVSFFDGHPFEEIAPDHPLLRALADVAADHDIPIDLHMEAIVADKPVPATIVSPANPETLHANIDGLGRLLDHNNDARIVWQHLGAQPTGDADAALVEQLLTDHTNLYVAIQAAGPNTSNAILRGGRLDPDWERLITDMADRFVIGADDFFATPRIAQQAPRSNTFDATWTIPDLLDPAVALALACDNPRRIYALDR